MSKLKTLKDLEEVKFMGLHPADENIFRNQFSKELKQEAIKWVKFFEDEETNSEGAKMINVGRMKSLIDFCNLTEKDLK